MTAMGYVCLPSCAAAIFLRAEALIFFLPAM
jgi:hypothetical protein